MTDPDPTGYHYSDDHPDDYGVWGRLCGDELGDGLAERATRYWELQAEYNRKVIHKCPGIQSLCPNQRVTAPHYCSSVLCPGCWHKVQLNIMKRAETIESPQWHVRETNALEIGDTFDPRVIKRFRARGSSYKAVGWCVSCELHGGFVPVGDGTTTYVEPTILYRYVGLFTSSKPIRSYSGANHDESGERMDGLVFSNSKEWIGQVTGSSYDSVHSALAAWEEANPHPAPVIGLDSLGASVGFIRTLGRKHYVAPKSQTETSSTEIVTSD